MAKVAPSIDLAAQATWPITLGASITATKRSASLTSVRYNNQPKLADRSTAKQSIRPTRAKAGCEASIKAGEQEWKYTGTHGTETDSYVLVLNDNGGSKKATLERISTVVALNLSATPNELDADKLQHKYQQLSLTSEAHHADQEITNDGEDASPDSDNPFDYRHFLDDDPKQIADSDTPKSTASTPAVQPVSRVSKPTVAAASNKRKTTELARPSNKRAKPAQQAATARPKTSKPDSVPAVRLDRVATMPQAREEDDSGELILENDDDDAAAAPDKHHSAMSLALNGQFSAQRGHGPISLHSAASSPASRNHSPALDGLELDNEEYDLGDEIVHEEDGDVEEFGLPSPRHDRKASKNTPANATLSVAEQNDEDDYDNNDDDDDDDDDDLEKQLAEAMGQDDAAPITRVQEEEESEEE